MSEAALVHAIRLALSQGPVRLFRNNVGMAVDAQGNHIRYGLVPGSSDLIGWRTRIIRPVDVGCEWAVFCAIEAKSAKGTPSSDQVNFIHAVRAAGGLAGIARTVEDAKFILQC